MKNSMKKELNEIRKELIKIKSFWEQDTINKRTEDINKLFDILENQNFNEFLKLNYHSYYFLKEDEIKAIINKYTDWLSNLEKVKQIILSKNGFYKIVHVGSLQNVPMWIEILKENEYGFVDTLYVRNVFRTNIDLDDEEFLELAFSKLENLYCLFGSFDFTKLNEKYFNNEKYINLILKSTHDPKTIKLLNKELLFKNENIWQLYSSKIIEAYGTEVIKYVDKSLWLNDHYDLNKLINLDINVFINYYDDIIKNKKLIDAAIEADYRVIKCIKNEDFTDEVKEIIINKLQSLAKELEYERNE